MANFDKYPPLELSAPFPFGQYRGKPVHEVIVQDTAYMLWLRADRRKLGQVDAGMSQEIHDLLDHAITSGHKSFKRYETQEKYLAKMTGVVPHKVEIPNTPVVEVEMEEWGSW